MNATTVLTLGFLTASIYPSRYSLLCSRRVGVGRVHFPDGFEEIQLVWLLLMLPQFYD